MRRDDRGDSASGNFCLTIASLARGDANGDGLTNILDAVTVVNHLLDIVPIIDPDALSAADCNRDGVVNILDALGIVNAVLGISNCEP